MKDLVGNEINVGDQCYYLKVITKANVALVEIVEFKSNGIICKVIKGSATIDKWKGVSNWKEGHITNALANTSLIKVGGL